MFTRISFGKNFLFSICSLFYSLFSFIILVFCLSLRFVTINYGSYRRSLGRPMFLRAYFAIRYVPFSVCIIFTICSRNFQRLTFQIVIIFLFLTSLYKNLDSSILFYNILQYYFLVSLTTSIYLEDQKPFIYSNSFFYSILTLIAFIITYISLYI